MNRWEYCEVSWQPHQITLTFFTMNGAQVHQTPPPQWAATLARLGLEGWELVSAIVSPTGVHEYWYYFKRSVRS